MAHVLLVDDDHPLLTMFKNALEAMNHTVVTAHNGEDALAVLDQSVDLLICDVQMPHMDGRELIRQIRARAEFEYLTIIAMTAFPNAVKPIGEIEGADGVLLKPVSVPELVTMIDNLLGRRSNSA